MIIQTQGVNITKESSLNEIWKAVAEILRPDRFTTNQLKIKGENETIVDPKELVMVFNHYFKKKVDELAKGIKEVNQEDHLRYLKKKHENSNLKFSLKIVEIAEVKKIIKDLKSKTSCGFDELSSELLKLGADVLAEPLTAIINQSILTGKFPTQWKASKVVPLFKKGDRWDLKNYRPVALLCVAGMVLEKVVFNQLEQYFEENNLFQEFQFGFRRQKSTISELLTLFDKLLKAKEEGSEISLLLFDLSAAFDTIDHELFSIKAKNLWL